MSTARSPNTSQYGGHDIPVLPVGSVRSIVAIKPPSASPQGLSLQSDGTLKNITRQHHSLHAGLSRINTTPSIATAIYYRQDSSALFDGKRILLVATCAPSIFDAHDVSTNSRRSGRISLASIIDSPSKENGDNLGCRVVSMQYSETDSESYSNSRTYNTVCIATMPMQQQSKLIAIDSCGMIYTCPIKQYSGENSNEVRSHILDMQKCHFNDGSDTPKKGKKAKSNNSSTSNGKNDLPPLGIMNTLSARMESVSHSDGSKHNASSDTTPISPITKKSPTKSSLSKKKGQKRKHSPTKPGSTPSGTDLLDTATTTERIYLVASNLNESILPSQSPPVVMLLSPTDKSQQYSAIWSTIPGLEHVDVPMTCILFISRAKCGPKIWNGIISTLGSNNDVNEKEDMGKQECDEGVVLMGFQDGSLRASLVATTTLDASDDGVSNTTLDIGKATTLVQLSCNEPFVSLQLIPSSSDASCDMPTLVCVGSLGTIVTLTSSLNKPPRFTTVSSLKPLLGRLTSLACVGYQFFDETEEAAVGLSFIGVNDSRETFLYRVCLLESQQSKSDSDAQIGFEQNVFRLPIPARMATSVHASPSQLIISSEGLNTHASFTLSSSSGKAVVMRFPLPEQKVANKSLSCGGFNTSLLSSLKGRDYALDEINRQKVDTGLKGESSTLQSLLQKLELASVEKNKSEAQHQFDLINRQSKHSMTEIREVSQVAAYVNRPPCKTKPLPIQCETRNIESGALKCAVKSEKMRLTRQPATSWIPSIHIMQSCVHTLSPMLRPQSTKCMSLLCYRRNNIRRSGRPIPVVYGGTSTSYNGNMKHISVSMNDFIPVSAFASLSMVYDDHIETGKNANNNSWQQSTEIASVSEGKAAQSRLFHSPGVAKRNIPCDDLFLGTSLPFDIGPKNSALNVDILAYLSRSGSHHSSANSDGESNSRDVAEKLVHQWFQNQSSSSQKEYIMPMIKEQQWICNHSTTKARDTEDAKVHCCSSSLLISNHPQLLSEAKEHCTNVGFGPLAINFPGGDQSDVAFAVGSSLITPNESLAILPLIRQAIIRQSLDHKKTRRSKENLKSLETYHILLTEKKTAKLTKHVERSCNDLLAALEKHEKEHLCPNELLTASISLYEILRTLNIAFI